MRGLILIAIMITVLGSLIGCNAYTTQSEMTFSNVMPIQKDIKLIVNKSSDQLEFKVMQNGYIVEADECILRNDNSHVLYANFGDYENIVYIIEDGYYTFGFYKDDITIVYEFRLSDLLESQIINY